MKRVPTRSLRCRARSVCHCFRRERGLVGPRLVQPDPPWSMRECLPRSGPTPRASRPARATSLNFCAELESVRGYATERSSGRAREGQGARTRSMLLGRKARSLVYVKSQGGGSGKLQLPDERFTWNGSANRSSSLQRLSTWNVFASATSVLPPARQPIAPRLGVPRGTSWAMSELSGTSLVRRDVTMHLWLVSMRCRVVNLSPCRWKTARGNQTDPRNVSSSGSAAGQLAKAGRPGAIR